MPARSRSSRSSARPFAGWERADSIVVNPHKWLFTPLDASLLLTRRMDQLRAAFSLVPEYLRTLDRASPVRDYNEYTPQLGRRLRALKLWILLRWFGIEGLRRRIDAHLELARRSPRWVDDDPDWERLAPVPFSTVCFRYRPARWPDARTRATSRPARRSQHAADGRGQPQRRGVPVAHAAAQRFTIRLAVGNLRTTERHVDGAWALLRAEAARLAAETPMGEAFTTRGSDA